MERDDVMCVTDPGDRMRAHWAMPRYTHLVVSAEDRDRLKQAQDLGALVAGVRAEAHCQDVIEAGRKLLERETSSNEIHGIVKLRQPIEY